MHYLPAAPRRLSFKRILLLTGVGVGLLLAVVMSYAVFMTLWGLSQLPTAVSSICSQSAATVTATKDRFKAKLNTVRIAGITPAVTGSANTDCLDGGGATAEAYFPLTAQSVTMAHAEVAQALGASTTAAPFTLVDGNGPYAEATALETTIAAADNTHYIVSYGFPLPVPYPIADPHQCVAAPQPQACAEAADQAIVNDLMRQPVKSVTLELSN